MQFHPISWYDPARTETNKNIWCFWDGPLERKPINNLCLQTVSKHNPNFQVVTLADLEAMPGGKEIIAETDGLAMPHRSDLVRLFLLDRFGGTWVDADVICYQRIDAYEDLETHNMSAVCKVGTQKTLASPISFRAGCPEVKHAMDRCRYLLGRKKAGIKQPWDATANLIYMDMVFSKKWNVKVREHWRYQRVFGDHGKYYAAGVQMAGQIAGPGAQFTHLGAGKKHLPSDGSIARLVATNRAYSALFRRALHLPGHLQGRSMEIIARLPAKPRMAELGVFKGWNCRGLLRMVDFDVMYLVDRWDVPTEQYLKSGDAIAASHRDQFKWSAVYRTLTEAIKPHLDSGKAQIIRDFTVAAADRIEDESLDMVFVDADHSYEGTRDDIAAWAPKVKPGGYIGGHDYAHPKFKLWGVKRAADEFAERVGKPLERGIDLTWFVRL